MLALSVRTYQSYIRSLIALPLALVLFIGCDSSDPAAPPPGTGNGAGGGNGGGGGGSETVIIRTTEDFRFDEEETLVGAGAVVQWISGSSMPHSVTPVGHEEWEPVETDQRGWMMLEHVFETPGTYEFRCDYHWESAGMTGRVVVFPTQ